MIKFTKILKESITIDEIEDYFLPINDILGSPKKNSIGKGDFVIYEFIWEIEFNISEYNEIDKLDNVIKCLDSIKELKTSQKRIEGYDINFRIENTLCVRLVPNNINSNIEYKFITEIEERNDGETYVTLSYSEVVRFFKNSELMVSITQSREHPNGCYLLITLNKIDHEANINFCKEIATEFGKTGYGRMVSLEARNDGIVIYPERKKTYIVIE